MGITLIFVSQKVVTRCGSCSDLLDCPGSLAAPSLVFFDAAGDQVQIHALADTRLLLLSAAPLEEPLATADAIVSNSPAELEQALEAIRTGLWGSLPA